MEASYAESRNLRTYGLSDSCCSGISSIRGERFSRRLERRIYHILRCHRLHLSVLNLRFFAAVSSTEFIRNLNEEPRDDPG